MGLEMLGSPSTGMAARALAGSLDQRGSADELLLHTGAWDYPLCRKEKTLRLFQLFEGELQQMGWDLEDLLIENQQLRLRDGTCKVHKPKLAGDTAQAFESLSESSAPSSPNRRDHQAVDDGQEEHKAHCSHESLKRPAPLALNHDLLCDSSTPADSTRPSCPTTSAHMTPRRQHFLLGVHRRMMHAEVSHRGTLGSDHYDYEHLGLAVTPRARNSYSILPPKITTHVSAWREQDGADSCVAPQPDRCHRNAETATTPRAISRISALVTPRAKTRSNDESTGDESKNWQRQNRPIIGSSRTFRLRQDLFENQGGQEQQRGKLSVEKETAELVSALGETARDAHDRRVSLAKVGRLVSALNETTREAHDRRVRLAKMRLTLRASCPKSLDVSSLSIS